VTEKIKIIYEDENIIAVDKPAGILSYPLPGSSEQTIGDMVGAQPAHRLDRDTSGVFLLAKNEMALTALQGLFKQRKIEKKYKALVWGKVEPKTGEIDIPLGRGSRDRLRVVPKSSGRESKTIYEVTKYYPKANISYCDINLKTGRTHQIRVHFSAIGHPVVGDQKYSNHKTDHGRQFLHAYKISFVSPFDGKNLNLTSELPSELSSYLNNL
jgi:23S rRNA pseudouridine1911/1915/1917 synthase